MSKYNRQEHLKQIHSKRKDLTFQKVDKAIKQLIKSNDNINFNSVASEAGVSKATLYNHKEIRGRIEELRTNQGRASSQSHRKRILNENNKDAIIDSLHRRIKRLEIENKKLREQLKFAYGDVYKQL